MSDDNEKWHDGVWWNTDGPWWEAHVDGRVVASGPDKAIVTAAYEFHAERAIER